MMEFKPHPTAAEFLTVAEAFLETHETEHNLMLGLAYAQRKNPPKTHDPVFATLWQGGVLVGCLQQSHPSRPLLISRTPLAGIPEIVEYLRSYSIPAVVAETQIADAFAREWTAVKGVQSRLSMHQGIYQLDLVQPLLPIEGNFRAFEMKDLPFLQDFAAGFVADCYPLEKDQKALAEDIAKRYSENPGVFFWVDSDDRPVSMAALNRESRNGATVSLVYTPPRSRGHGFGSAVVAALSRHLLAGGRKFCNLYTDLSNPTSNSIYQRIGYVQVGESKHIEFENRKED